MALRLGALHDALRDPGNVEKAQKAAEEVAENQVAGLRSDLVLLRWMVGLNLAATLAVLLSHLFG